MMMDLNMLAREKPDCLRAIGLLASYGYYLNKQLTHGVRQLAGSGQL